MYVGLSYFLGEEITKRIGKAGTRAVIGVIVIVIIGLCIRAAVSRWRSTHSAAPAGPQFRRGSRSTTMDRGPTVT